MSSDEVVIVPYDERWPALYETAAFELREALGEALVGIEHIGSTAVPGLAAKPIVDVAVGVDTLARGRALVDAVVGLGYEYVPEHEAELPFRRFFHRRPAGQVGYHVHLVERAHEFWTAQVEFRDHLRAHPDDAAAYEALKRGLAERFRTERRSYTDAKGDFVAAMLAKARSRY
ncbi:MAG: GrpB family protein [Gaiellaceae bacterium]